MHLKMSSWKWRPFCLGLNVLMIWAKSVCIKPRQKDNTALTVCICFRFTAQKAVIRTYIPSLRFITQCRQYRLLSSSERIIYNLGAVLTFTIVSCILCIYRLSEKKPLSCPKTRLTRLIFFPFVFVLFRLPPYNNCTYFGAEVKCIIEIFIGIMHPRTDDMGSPQILFMINYHQCFDN